jgi:hypothetical protein
LPKGTAMTSCHKSKTPEYMVWKQMRYRCTKRNHKTFHSYGGRGVTVCKEWSESFDKFIEDMGPRPKGYQIDRTDNNKGYYKENCKWVTREENNKNKAWLNGKYLLGASMTERGNFRSRIKIEGKTYFIGYFKTEIKAQDAYLKIYKEWFGKLPQIRGGK